MDNQVSLHNKNVTVVLVDHFAHLVQLVHLNMTSDMAIANHVKTYHQMHSMIKLHKALHDVHISVNKNLNLLKLTLNA